MATPETTYTGFQDRTPREVAEHAVFKGKSVCDVGCGTGEFLGHLAREAIAITSGVEKSLEAEIAINEGYNIVQGRALQVDIPDAQVYYFWIQSLGEALQIIDEKHLTGTMVFGNYTNYMETRYLESIGAVKHLVKTTRGDFIIWILEK